MITVIRRTYILDLGAERQRTNIPEQGFELNLINPDVLRETFQLYYSSRLAS